jgi:hypothetical protein
MRTPDINLHIDRLVLHGIAPGDRHPVGLAIGDELTRLLTVDGLSPSLTRGADVDRIDAGTFRQPTAARPSTNGAPISRTVHRGLLR